MFSTRKPTRRLLSFIRDWVKAAAIVGASTPGIFTSPLHLLLSKIKSTNLSPSLNLTTNLLLRLFT